MGTRVRAASPLSPPAPSALLGRVRVGEGKPGSDEQWAFLFLPVFLAGLWSARCLQSLELLWEPEQTSPHARGGQQHRAGPKGGLQVRSVYVEAWGSWGRRLGGRSSDSSRTWPGSDHCGAPSSPPTVLPLLLSMTLHPPLEEVGNKSKGTGRTFMAQRKMQARLGCTSEPWVQVRAPPPTEKVERKRGGVPVSLGLHVRVLMG